MDILSIQKHEGECVIRAPFKGNKPLGLSIWMQSLTCDEVQAVKERHAEENLALVKAGAERIPNEVKERQGVECYAAAITRWEFSGDASFGKEEDGTPIIPEFSYDNAVDMLTKSDLILGQLVTFSTIEEHFYSNFAKGS